MQCLWKIALRPSTQIIVLSIVVWLVFARTTGSYFLADDFGEVAYASKIFAGNYHLLWSNFTSNFMQVPGMAVWRPWLMMSLFIDFCIWRANPMGFYLTNLLSYNMVVVLFYLLIRALERSSQQDKSSLVALLSGALFAVSPLHCESVSWVVGRVDIICAVFYLACLNLSLHADRTFPICKKTKNAKKTSWEKPSNWYTALAVICFWLAMWTKEMAIGAPVLVTTILLLFGQQPFNLKRTWKLSSPLWLSTAIYFALRYLALGTLLGGYVQGIGDSQAANALSRWLDPDTARRLFFPFAHNIFGDYPGQQAYLLVFYIILLTLIAIRATSLSISLRWLALISVWIVTCLAPIYKLWGLGYNLEGGRFCFFLTLPLSLLLPALLFLQGRHRKLTPRANSAISWLGVAATIGSIIILGKAAYRNNLDWVHAGQEVRALSKQAQLLSTAVATSDKKILILGIPKRLGGAHMILNGNTFATALKPPFMPIDYSKPFITFEPIQFAESPYINSDRFKSLVNRQHSVVVWNSIERQFNNIKYPDARIKPLLTLANPQAGYVHRLGGTRASASTPTEERAGVSFCNVKPYDSFAFSALNLNPLIADYFEAKIKVLDKKSEPLKLGFSIDDETQSYYQSKPIKSALEAQMIRVPLSKDWQWFSKPKIESIFLMLPPSRNIELSNCRLVSTAEVAPVLQLTSGKESFEGVVEQTRPGEDIQSIAAKVSLPPLEGIATIQIETSKPNAFFENFPADEGKAAIMNHQNFAKASSEANNHTPRTGSTFNQKIKIDTGQLSSDAYHQMRVRLLDSGGSTVGELSNPVTVKVSF